jgi:SAM-dependent methyltransferase
MPGQPPSSGSPAPGRLRRLVVEGVRYWAGRFAGQSYQEYQAARYERLWQADPKHFSHPDRTFQLEYCRAHGLAPEHRFLDFGCGPVAAGLHFVRFLAPGRYFGADISSQALAHGEAALHAAGLADRAPTLVHLDPPGSLDALRGTGFDLVWAQSVLTHMAPHQITRLIGALPDLLAPGGKLLATAYLGRRTRRIAFKDWGYDVDFYTALAASTAMSCEVHDDFRHPHPFEPPGYRMTMLAFTPPAADGVSRAGH